MKWSRRKSWRKIPTQLEKRKLIRKVCCSILVLELAFFAREWGNTWVFVSREEEVRMEPAGEAEEGYEKIYGIRFRLEEGLVDFYKKEEFRDGK